MRRSSAADRGVLDERRPDLRGPAGLELVQPVREDAQGSDVGVAEAEAEDHGADRRRCVESPSSAGEDVVPGGQPRATRSARTGSMCASEDSLDSG